MHSVTLALVRRIVLAGSISLLLADQACAAPAVVGFERFFTTAGADQAAGGRLLLGELNCTSCHQAEKSLEAVITTKQAPILDAVGSRIQVDYLRTFLSNPHAAKPGTTMPDLLAGRPPAERQQAVEALVHFLASTGVVSQASPDRKLAANGSKLFHQVGCVACHGPHESSKTASQTPPANSVPLGDLTQKYTIPSLIAFLQDPLKVRPSGRMPGLNLKPEEARDIAHFLLPDARFDTPPNLAFQYYEGEWDRLPDFEKLPAKASGKAAGFDLGVAARGNNFALRFEGYLQIERAGDYTFHVGSDDGARLWIDDRLVVDNDGIHAPQTVSGTTSLIKGPHRVVAAVFNAGGGAELDVQYEGRGLARQPLGHWLLLKPEEANARPAAERPASTETRFVLDAELARQGRELFATLGCASCHAMQFNKQPIESKLAAPALASLKTSGGCLANEPVKNAAHYTLNASQQKSIAAALTQLASSTRPTPPTPQQQIARTLTAFNCYACHDRNGVGGVEESRNAFFQTNQKEMGDEGRIPPSLNGVGAKLTAAWMKRLFANGASDRPYMLTRMPKFGDSHLVHLIAAFEARDTLEAVPPLEFTQPLRRVKSDGRHLVGNQALGCIKCHNFKNEKASGIQAMNMSTMAERLKHDWFHRYLANPQQFRPGTRMPAAWPNGQTFYKDLLGGSISKQIEAVWLYLADGNKAAPPYGLGSQPIPLVPQSEPIVYRNFIQGAGPRAIAVGYPEKANLAFDANDLRLALLWQNAFIDASPHWSNRGQGFQTPLGDNVLQLPAGTTFAVLGDSQADWPTQPAKEQGYQFRGYRLDDQRRPTFLYDYQGIQIEDTPSPMSGPLGPAFERRLTLKSAGSAPRLYFRAAVSKHIEPAGDGWYTLDGQWKLQLKGSGEPLVRTLDGNQELLLPLTFENGQAEISQQFVW